MVLRTGLCPRPFPHQVQFAGALPPVPFPQREAPSGVAPVREGGLSDHILAASTASRQKPRQMRDSSAVQVLVNPNVRVGTPPKQIDPRHKDKVVEVSWPPMRRKLLLDG